MIRPLTQFDFHHSLEDTQGISLVAFTAPGCGACDMLLSALERFSENRTDVGLFEVNVQQDTALGQEFDVFHLPALFLYIDGHYHREIRCESLPEKIAEALDSACRSSAEEAP